MATHETLNAFGQVLLAISKAERSDPPDPALMQQARQWLDGGLDPNTPDAIGHTLLWQLGLVTRGTHRGCQELALLLLEYGANPMLHDKPLGTVIQHQFSSLLVNDILWHLGKLDRQGKGLRDLYEGNVLHYLAWQNPQLAAEHLEEDLSSEEPDRYFPLFLASMARPLDGATPLHVLWRKGVDKHQQAEIDSRWFLTRMLLDAGADPLARDDQGVLAAEQVERWVVQGGSLPADDTWGRLFAPLQALRLHDTTTAVPSSARSPRL